MAAVIADNAWDRSQRMAAIVAAATQPPPPHKMSGYSRMERPGDGALFNASVVCRASLPGAELHRERRTAVVKKASALL